MSDAPELLKPVKQSELKSQLKEAPKFFQGEWKEDLYQNTVEDFRSIESVKSAQHEGMIRSMVAFYEKHGTKSGDTRAALVAQGELETGQNWLREEQNEESIDQKKLKKFYKEQKANAKKDIGEKKEYQIRHTLQKKAKAATMQTSRMMLHLQKHISAETEPDPKDWKEWEDQVLSFDVFSKSADTDASVPEEQRMYNLCREDYVRDHLEELMTYLDRMKRVIEHRTALEQADPEHISTTEKELTKAMREQADGFQSLLETTLHNNGIDASLLAMTKEERKQRLEKEGPEALLDKAGKGHVNAEDRIKLQTARFKDLRKLTKKLEEKKWKKVENDGFSAYFQHVGQNDSIKELYQKEAAKVNADYEKVLKRSQTMKTFTHEGETFTLTELEYNYLMNDALQHGRIKRGLPTGGPITEEDIRIAKGLANGKLFTSRIDVERYQKRLKTTENEKRGLDRFYSINHSEGEDSLEHTIYGAREYLANDREIDEKKKKALLKICDRADLLTNMRFYASWKETWIHSMEDSAKEEANSGANKRKYEKGNVDAKDMYKYFLQEKPGSLTDREISSRRKHFSELYTPLQQQALHLTRIIQIMYLTNKQTKDNIILNMENIRATEETNESMLTPLERHLWNQFLNGTEGAGNGNE